MRTCSNKSERMSLRAFHLVVNVGIASQGFIRSQSEGAMKGEHEEVGGVR